MKVLIWGTGNFGKYISQQIEQKQNIDIKCYIDSNQQKWGTQFNNRLIISPSELEKFYEKNDVILVAFTNGITIFEQINVKYNCKFGIIRNCVFEAKLQLKDDILTDNNIIWNDAEFLQKPMLHSLETNIMDGCNLNCRGCSHFSNLFHRDEKIKFETFCRDLKRITDNVYIYRFNMLGGEALLNNRLIDYIEYAKKVMPDTDIELVTNGLLIPKQDKSFFESCRKNGVIIGISGYKPTLALKNQIIEVLEENQVTYIFRDVVENFGKNIDLAGKNDIEIAVKSCRESRCHFMRQGKIYKCPFEALGNKLFTHFNIDIELNGGIDIYKEDLNWQEVVSSLHNNSVEACRFCGKEEQIEWRVANPPCLEDWVI